MTLDFEGNGLSGLDNEAGGHRVQRIPPTEKRGRVHSSTVTVAVLGAGAHTDLSAFARRDEDDFGVEYYSGSGAGGQNRNKVQACVRLTHLPTGTVKTAQTRSRENSLKLAHQAMTAELDRMSGLAGHRAENNARQDQVGSGQRGDKRRTYRFQDDQVTDHATGRKGRVKDVMNGAFEALWA